jgi:hypothetical protein
MLYYFLAGTTVIRAITETAQKRETKHTTTDKKGTYKRE